MSLIRALRAYVGLGPDDEFGDDYFRDLADPELGLDLTGSEPVIDDRAHRSERFDRGERAQRPGRAETGDVQPGDLARRARRRYAEVGYGVHRDNQGAASRNGRGATDEGNAVVEDGYSDPDEEWSDLIDDLDDGYEYPTDDGRDHRMGSPDDHRPTTDEDDAVIHSLDSLRAKPKTIVPESFADAKVVADEYKFGVPVVINLQGGDRELARRLIDFASGLCYALDGSMEKIAPQVFLVIPDGVTVAESDRDKIRQRGYAR